MNIIIPIEITDAMIASGSPGEPSMPSGTLWAPGPYPSTGTVRLRPNSRSYQVITTHTSDANSPPPERDPANWLDLGPTPVPVEVAWSPYVAVRTGDEVIRTQTHRRYRATKDITALDNVIAPEMDETAWREFGPTNRWAPFDQYSNTRAIGTTSITYVLTQGFFNSLALYGLVGTQYSVTVKDAPGGSVIFSSTGYLTEDPAGWYEYLFAPPRQKNKLVLTGIPIRATAEVTITISTGSGQSVGIGMIAVGDLVPMFLEGEWGGTEYGATAEPVTYSYINTDEYGATRIVRRHSTTNLRCTVSLPRQYADNAVRILQSVLDRPVACIATTAPGYDGLNVFGLIGSAPVSYDSFNTASIDFTVKGLI